MRSICLPACNEDVEVERKLLKFQMHSEDMTVMNRAMMRELASEIPPLSYTTPLGNMSEGQNNIMGLFIRHRPAKGASAYLGGGWGRGVGSHRLAGLLLGPWHASINRTEERYIGSTSKGLDVSGAGWFGRANRTAAATSQTTAWAGLQPITVALAAATSSAVGIPVPAHTRAQYCQILLMRGLWPSMGCDSYAFRLVS